MKIIKGKDLSNRIDIDSTIENERNPGQHSLPEQVKRIAVIVFGIGLGFVLVEIMVRSFDPYPYIPQWKINHTEHGNLMQYDSILGWDGVPSSEEWFITKNAKVWVEHNHYGFRDIEPHERSDNKPALVFLGDSFTWGYEVGFEDMFVNHIRRQISEYEIYNLAHRGYGTDQSLLTFREWNENSKIDAVILMFSENDFRNNEDDFSAGKPKPMFDIVDNELFLGNVPLPELNEWSVDPSSPQDSPNIKDLIKQFLFQSHFLHDINFRRKQLRNPIAVDQIVQQSHMIPQSDLTSMILKELKTEVENRGALFTTIAIPSKIQFMGLKGFIPYQNHLRTICQELDIEFVDLAPYFSDAVRSPYFRDGMHWNAYGHYIAGEAIFGYLRSKGF